LDCRRHLKYIPTPDIWHRSIGGAKQQGTRESTAIGRESNAYRTVVAGGLRKLASLRFGYRKATDLGGLGSVDAGRLRHNEKFLTTASWNIKVSERIVSAC
jgi:hypothetical protein